MLDWVRDLAEAAGIQHPAPFARALTLLLDGGLASGTLDASPDAPEAAKASARALVTAAVRWLPVAVSRRPAVRPSGNCVAGRVAAEDASESSTASAFRRGWETGAAMSASVAARSLGLCFAHPDDESYSTYGTVALHAADPQFRLVVLHATDGGAGEVAPDSPVEPDLLGQHRRQEDDEAWVAVGHPPDRHVWLGHEDGDLAAVAPARLIEEVAAFLEAERPDVVVTFGPDGVTGHPDHLAIGRATDEAFHLLRRGRGPGLLRLLHVAIAATPFERHQAAREARGMPRWDPDVVYHLRAVPDADIDVLVDTRAVADVVVAGLKAHRTQRRVLYDPDGDDEDWRRYAKREFHVLAWPPRPPGAPQLTDVFAGLGS